MYKRKLTAEESLDIIKLRMKYDVSKTLNENIDGMSPLVEQKSAAANITKDAVAAAAKKVSTNMLTDQDLMGSTSVMRSLLQSLSDYSALVGLPNLWDMVGINAANLIAGRRTGVKGVVDALDGWVDAADLAYVLGIVKSLDGKCYTDPVEGTNVSATQRFLELYKEDESGDELKSDVDSVGTRTLPTGTEQVKRLINATIDKQVAAGCKASKSGGGGGTGGGKAAATVPAELKDVKGFQDWLDKNKAGWATGYKDGIINQGKNGGGYGLFGPRTSAAWNKHKDEYLKGGSTSTSASDIETGNDAQTDQAF